MFKRYVARLVLRLPIAGLILYLYISQRELVASYTAFVPWRPFSLWHVLWTLLMANMLLQLLPQSLLSLAGKKQFPQHYQAPRRDINRLELLEYVQSANIRAWRVMLLWLSAHGLLALAYLAELLGPAELLLLSSAYFVADLVCVLFFCPFQRWLMKCRCCINCRIFDWGHFMMYTPLLLVRSFYSWSLFFAACVVLIKWELNYARHPERFWSGSNEALACANCRDKLCRVKKPLKAA